MLLAVSSKGDKHVLILGLEAENIRRLLNDEPIRKDLGKLGAPGFENFEVYILGPEDTVRLVARVGDDPPMLSHDGDAL